MFVREYPHRPATKAEPDRAQTLPVTTRTTRCRDQGDPLVEQYRALPHVSNRPLVPRKPPIYPSAQRGCASGRKIAGGVRSPSPCTVASRMSRLPLHRLSSLVGGGNNVKPSNCSDGRKAHTAARRSFCRRTSRTDRVIVLYDDGSNSNRLSAGCDLRSADTFPCTLGDRRDIAASSFLQGGAGWRDTSTRSSDGHRALLGSTRIDPLRSK